LLFALNSIKGHESLKDIISTPDSDNRLISSVYVLMATFNFSFLIDFL